VTLKALDRQSIGQAAQQLAEIDPALDRVLRQHGAPPLWKRPATFATLVRIILEQQVSLASAYSTFTKLRTACDGRVTAGAVESLGGDGLRRVGFSRQKARYALALADDVIQRRLKIGSLRHLDDDEVRSSITERLGLGDWSADVFLMMALCRPDILPLGDLGLVKGMTELDGVRYDRREQIIQRAKIWKPYRSVACRMVWQLYLGNRNQTVP
jgi:DNA-3-methyladenine glycosylase II